MAGKAATFFQVGVVVVDLEAAIEEYGRVAGLEFTAPREREMGDWRFRAAHSRQGPPYLELIQGDPGTPWDAAGHPHVQHLAFSSPDVDREAERLAREGFSRSLDGREYGSPVVMHDTRHAGVMVEHLDATARERLEDTIRRRE